MVTCLMCYRHVDSLQGPELYTTQLAILKYRSDLANVNRSDHSYSEIIHGSILNFVFLFVEYFNIIIKIWNMTRIVLIIINTVVRVVAFVAS